jgi:geranylgeranyl pyrophosphate synthase
LSEGKSTLPLIHSYLNSNDGDKKIILEIFEGKILSKSDMLLEIFKRNNSDVYTENKIKEYSNNAIKSLDKFSGDAKESLVDLTNFCSERLK